MEIKKMDAAGLDFLAIEEGLRLKPYRDSKGIPTIGIGNTYYENGNRVTMNDPAITKERAIELFKNVLDHYEVTVWSVTRDDIIQNQFNALVSICYNIGVNGFKGSTLLSLVNKNPQHPQITEAFKMWRKPNLLERRKREAKLYFS